jgi:hypothetical protein
MQPHQRRILDEQIKLTDEIAELHKFRIGPIFNSLPAEERSRLNRQMLIMELYEQVLSERILAF